jgi:hypothetical protein
MGIGSALRRHPGRTATGAAVTLAAAGFLLYWFAPWNLIVDRRVDEALPSVGAPVGEAPLAESSGTGSSDEVSADEAGTDEVAAEEEMTDDDPSGPVTLARGRFRGLEHETSGTALVVELPDGSRFLRLEDLETSNGPDLRVILTDQPLSEDWHVWDDGELVDLGPLKGNLGSSNYEIPQSVDLDGFRTAVVWCRRFSVGFGVAPIATT